MKTATQSPAFAGLVQRFFLQRLIAQRGVSPQTVASYRDTFKLLFCFAEQYYRKPIASFLLTDLNPSFVVQFLDHLEQTRKNSIATRNTRLAAIRSFARYAILQDPTAMVGLHGVLAIPTKRFKRASLPILSREEIEVILNAPDLRTWSGRRDHALLLTLYNTGARVSEIAAVRCGDLQCQSGATLLLHGKGRKDRTVPLWKRTRQVLKDWLAEIDTHAQRPLFPNREGKALTRAGIEYRLKVTVKIAVSLCPSLAQIAISPHTFRHVTATHLLQSGVDLSVVGLLLGHESVQTTHQYIDANMTMKENALSSLQPPDVKPLRYRAPTGMLAFLDGLTMQSHRV